MSKRLQELLDKKDEEIEELERKLAKYQEEEEYEAEEAAWSWTVHTILEKDDAVLPVPRLELRWESLDEQGYNRICQYSLVYEHLLGDIIKIPMGRTRVGGSRDTVIDDGMHNGEQRRQPSIDTPFRDGGHITNDSRKLKLPAFIIAEGKVQELIPREDRGYDLGPLKDLEHL